MTRSRLREEIERFDPSRPLESARTPPSSWYLDARVQELEARSVFRTWQYAGPADRVAAPGDHLRMDLLGESYVVIRGDDGVLRGFHNVCRHHAAELVAEPGSCEALVCPYHGWTYALDGRLVRAPGMGRMEGFDPAAFSLQEVPVETWGPLVFLHPGDPKGTVADELAPLDDALRDQGLDGLRWVSRRSYPMRCNWKVFADNYLDGGYHIEHLHGGLASQIDMRSYRTETFDRLSIQTCPSRDDAKDFRGLDFSARIGTGAVYAYHYPNFALNRYGPILDVNWLVPIATDRCEVVFDYWFPESGEAACEEFVTKSLEASHQVQLEDVGISESVQRGVGSSSYDTGRYAASETAMLHFHRLLSADLWSALTAED